MMKFEPFHCPQCGEMVEGSYPDSGDLRTIRKDDQLITRPYPRILIPKCGGCGEIALTQAESEEIDRLMESDT